MPAKAYFLTWTTYGTWLPGDDRESVTHGNNRYKDPFSPPDVCVADAARKTMPHAPLTLTKHMRAVVDQAIVDHCNHRGWRLHALNVRTNHVHAVVSAIDTPEIVMTQFKAWSTRRLREQDLVDPTTKVWTKHGSTRYIWEQESIEPAVRYVRDAQ
jgi:REP element-mobilizing transposase RayT